MATSSGRDEGGRELPRGIEVLVKKAAVDAGFKALLLEERAGAAAEINLELDPAEAAMLMAIPAAQLETIIAATKVDEKVRPAFLGKAAAVMVAALGVGELAGCNVMLQSKGARPDRPPDARSDDSVSPRPQSAGIIPDRVQRAGPAKAEGDRTEADDGRE
ncbi:MAG: hypothetical protein ACYS9X_11215 [Planctomycetota bacterium]|jgi:hypothetical protein